MQKQKKKGGLSRFACSHGRNQSVIMNWWRGHWSSERSLSRGGIVQLCWWPGVGGRKPETGPGRPNNSFWFPYLSGHHSSPPPADLFTLPAGIRSHPIVGANFPGPARRTWSHLDLINEWTEHKPLFLKWLAMMPSDNWVFALNRIHIFIIIHLETPSSIATILEFIFKLQCSYYLY